MRLILKASLLVLTFGCINSASAQTEQGYYDKDRPVYHIAYVQVKPGKEHEYRKFVQEVFKPLWVGAVKAGIVESWTAYEHPNYFGSNAGYSHILIVKMKGFATFDTLIPELLKIASKILPGDSMLGEAEKLMDIVKSDVLYEFAGTGNPDTESKPGGSEKK